MSVTQIKKKYSAYPKYKLSGIDWLGNIPEDWEVQTLRNLGFFTSSGIDKKIVEGEPLVKMVNYTDIYGNASLIIDKNRELMTVSCPVWKVLKSDLTNGDLVFTPSSETTEDIGLSALIFEKLKNTVFSYHVIRFRFKQVFDHLFKKYLCNNNFVLQQFTQLAKGTTRQIIDRNDFKNICVVIPPLKVQEYISKFLDNQIKKIDLIIEKKQKLIELLKEKRIVLISQTVTKGLGPQAELKSSGIEWLGDIPEKWEIKKLKYISNTRVSNVDKKSEDEINIKLCNYIDVYKNEIIQDNIEFMKATATIAQVDKFNLRNNDVIITKDSETSDDIGIPAYVLLSSTKDIVCGYHLAQITTNESLLLGKYLFRLFQSMNYKNYFDISSNGVTRFGLKTYAIINIPILLPKIVHQQQIVDFLDRETEKINKAIEKIQQQIEFIKEYRMALIANTVTGKIMIN